MKKILFLLLVGGGAYLAKKKLDEDRTEQALWTEATDNIEPA